MRKITKYYIFIVISFLTLSAAFATDNITCETDANSFLFEKSGKILETVRSSVINRCDDSLLVSDKYDCVKNVKCFDNSVSQQLISCSTRSNNQSFKAANTLLSKSQASVLKQCISNPYTSRNDCYDNLECND